MVIYDLYVTFNVAIKSRIAHHHEQGSSKYIQSWKNTIHYQHDNYRGKKSYSLMVTAEENFSWTLGMGVWPSPNLHFIRWQDAHHHIFSVFEHDLWKQTIPLILTYFGNNVPTLDCSQRARIPREQCSWSIFPPPEVHCFHSVTRALKHNAFRLANVSTLTPEIGKIKECPLPQSLFLYQIRLY